VDFLNFSESNLNVIIFCNFAKMDGNGKLSGLDGDHIRWPGKLGRKESFVVFEVFNSECGTHNDDAEGVVLKFLLI
jgi:hypothetical protein